MKFRITALLVVLPALLAALLVVTPAEASTHDAYMRSSKIAINSDGLGKVSMSCHSSHTCKGILKFAGSTRQRSFSVPGKTTKYVEVAVHAPTDPAYPDTGDSVPFHTSARLGVHETSPRDRKYSYAVATETPVPRRNITGHINAKGGAGHMTNLTVQLLSLVRGGNVKLVHSQRVNEGGTYSFNANLGTNNSPSKPFKLRISGIDKDGDSRSWYWRGSSGATTGGTRYIRKASTVQAVSSSDFIADFNYGSISGTISDSDGHALAKAPIVVAAPPTPGADATTQREFDLAYCADIHGRTTTDSSGNYEEDFLPFAPGDRRYMVGATDGPRETWNADFGSCLDTIGYSAHTNAHLIDLGSGHATESFKVKAGNTVTVDGHFSGFTGTTQGDRWITIRERVPGLTALEDPVVQQSLADASGNATFTDIPKGQYVVELGRRTGCSDWQKSKFPNNSAYFQGLDRGAEAWKSFTKLSALSSSMERIARNVRPNHATTAEQGHVPSGYRGWMYRDYCKAYGTGTINTMTLTDFGATITKDTSTDHKGAIVHGHVSRTGGRTNKEMMVRLSSSNQTLVLRTDLTDSGGNFYVAGLASGTYTITVNSDSWRGIGRTFTGRHTITVKAGHTYSAGTLTFRG